MVPLTVNTQVRGPLASMQARREPEPESARVVTGITRPPRPPRLSAPPPPPPARGRPPHPSPPCWSPAQLKPAALAAPTQLSTVAPDAMSRLDRARVLASV